MKTNFRKAVSAALLGDKHKAVRLLYAAAPLTKSQVRIWHKILNRI